ncbi:hypothetical protein [Yersinia intermedia]|uniref:hypothetical protein n=1 Tax=Yersinia intermedia TaxID=631 RepID=UPI001BAF638D|nr:hypothetical protein [Yersinia intermedia]
MHRIDTSTAQIDKFGAGKNGFTGGNPQTGELPTALDNDYFDAIQEELAKIIETTGVTLDKSKHDQIITALEKLFLQTGNRFSEIKDAGAAAVAAALANLGLGTGLTGVIGDARNAKMSVTAASATATFTADELIVGVALGGLQYRLGSFSKTINLATTGAGGMDTGAAPASGYVALYAIYNPTTAASALLAVNATAAIAPMVYGGANMPAGYTASALVSVWRTSSSIFVRGFQRDRNLSLDLVSVLSTSGGAATLQTLNISAAAPLNAKSISIGGNTTTSGSSALFLNIYGSSYGVALTSLATTSTGITLTLPSVQLDTPQTVYYTYGPSGASQTLGVSAYSI